MTRSVVFDVSGVLEAFDYRGVLIHTQEIKAEQSVKLPFTQKKTKPQARSPKRKKTLTMK